MKPSEFSSMDPLLVKYLLQETTAGETVLAEQWIASAPDHAHYFEQFKKLWQASKSLDQAVPPDEQEAWQRFRIRAGVGHPKPTARGRLLRIGRAAALWILVIAGAWMLYRTFRPPAGGRVLASGATTLTDTLADKTIVTLNKHSTIRIPAGFGQRSRAITLEGEAFFEVSVDSRLPFMVQAPGVRVTVLGTAFNVNSRDKHTEIIVEHGKVEVDGAQNSVQLSAGEKVVVGPADTPMDKQQVRNALYNYYRTGAIVCQNTPLSAVIHSLNEAYDAHITLEDEALGRLPLTTTFYLTQPLDSILQIIHQTFPQLTVSRQGTQILIK